MRSSFRNSSRVFAVLALFTITLPFAAYAATATDILRVQSTATVSRGDFLRAAVKALHLQNEQADESVLSQYMRVPAALRTYVAIAHAHGALKLFGNDLILGKGITRGEAVQIVASLGDFDPVVPTATFKDVRKGSRLEGAVGIALEGQWIAPIRSDVFGSTRVLTGVDATNFIAALLGKPAPIVREMKRNEQKKASEENTAEQDDTPTIQINLQSEDTFPKGEILWTVWQLIQKNFLYQDRVKPDEAAYTAAEALMNSLGDPYSVFMRPVNSKQFQTQIQGEVTGIGAQVEYKENILTIVTPLRGSPAEAAGLKPGDQIVGADGEDLVGIGFAESVEKVRGPQGSSVELTIRRDGNEFKKVVRRDVIKVPEIEISWQGEFAIVKLLQFGQLTDTQLRQEMLHIQEQKPKGIVLDLRNNPGGLLHAADTVVSNFAAKGSPVAKVEALDGERIEYTQDEPTIDRGVPLVVLVNGGSASASEIVAAALQDMKRATIIGEKSYGKGTVQQVLQFSDESAVKMTIAEWLSPNGRKIDGIGVKPDIEVPTDERDSQMSKALDLLRAQAR